MTPPVRPLAGLAGDQGGAMSEMANRDPRRPGLPMTGPAMTGLAMTVWVGPRGPARQDARVELSRAGGDRMVLDDAAVISIRPAPPLPEGPLGAAELAAVSHWIGHNPGVLVDDRSGTAGTVHPIGRLQRV